MLRPAPIARILSAAKPPSGGCRGASRGSGYALIEVLIALPIVAVAGVMLFGTMTGTARQRALNRETIVVVEAARATIERIRNEALVDVFALYNADPFDDPDGPGTAPGASFAIPGIRAVEGAPNRLPGEVVLPSVVVDEGPPELWALREDLDLPDLGLPRDLNGDNAIDDVDHSGDCVFLPIRVVVSWQGKHGPRTLHMETTLVDYRYE